MEHICGASCWWCRSSITAGLLTTKFQAMGEISRLSDYVVSVMHDNVDLWSIVGLDVSRVCIYLGIWITIMRESGLRRSCDRLECFRLTARLGCVEGWGGNKGARVTCECLMAETDTHVLRIVNGIWVGKIVFLIFRICVNSSVYTENGPISCS